MRRKVKVEGVRKFKSHANITSKRSEFHVPHVDSNVAAVLNGYPYKVFIDLSEDMGLPFKQLSKVTRIASTTLNRRESEGKFSVPESDRLYMTQKIFKLAVDVTGSKENARVWLSTPQISLNNEKPLDYINTIPGADIVMNLLYAMEYGVYL